MNLVSLLFSLTAPASADCRIYPDWGEEGGGKILVVCDGGLRPAVLPASSSDPEIRAAQREMDGDDPAVIDIVIPVESGTEEVDRERRCVIKGDAAQVSMLCRDLVTPLRAAGCESWFISGTIDGNPATGQRMIDFRMYAEDTFCEQTLSNGWGRLPISSRMDPARAPQIGTECAQVCIDPVTTVISR